MHKDMTPQRWQQVLAQFEALVDLPPAQREPRLVALGADDAALRDAVAAMLAADPGEDGGETLRGHSPALLGDLSERIAATGDGERLIGRHLGSWTVEQRIGAGGMGAVYLGRRHDGQFQQQVAIKVLRGVDAGDADLLLRFRAERQILAQLDHPYIARLLDGGALPDGTPYLVMEYIEGEPIDAFCARRKLDLRARLGLLVRVCLAVQAAHRALVVHRDLKPANILVDAHGEPKLLDFGIAKVLGEHAGSAATVDGAQLLTPRYAAPEQVAGTLVTTATDVYALGILMAELLTGRSPYAAAAGDNLALMRAVADAQVTAPSRTLRIDAPGAKRLRSIRAACAAISTPS